MISYRKLPDGRPAIVLSREDCVRAPHDGGISYATGEIVAPIEIEQWADIEDAEKIIDEIRERLADTGISFPEDEDEDEGDR